MDIKEIGCGLNLTGSGWGPVAGFYGHDNGPSGSTKVGNFLTNWATISSSIWNQWVSQSVRRNWLSYNSVPHFAILVPLCRWGRCWPAQCSTVVKKQRLTNSWE